MADQLQNTDNPYNFQTNDGSDISGPAVPMLYDLAPRIWGATSGQQSLADQASCADYQAWKLSPKTIESPPTGD